MEKNYIDLSKLSEQIGCKFEDVEVAPRHVVRQTHWSKKEYNAAKKMLQDHMSTNSNSAVSIYGGPDPWNTVGLVRELDITYTYPWPEHPEMVELDLKPLPLGLPEYNYDVQYQIREEGDSVLINMTSDNPEKASRDGTPHTFKLENVTKVHVPEIAPVKDVYLHAWGMYSVMCAVAATLAETARSVFLSCHETDYFCCASCTPEHEIGDRAPRTWENTLQHC